VAGVGLAVAAAADEDVGHGGGDDGGEGAGEGVAGPVGGREEPGVGVPAVGAAAIVGAGPVGGAVGYGAGGRGGRGGGEEEREREGAARGDRSEREHGGGEAWTGLVKASRATGQ